MTRRWLATALSVLIIPATLVAGPVHPASATLATVQVVTGGSHTCALAPSGQTYCWGKNDSGQLGDNTTTDRNAPVAVQQGGVTFASITAGAGYTCGLTSAGAAYCWGRNVGQLGDNTTAQRTTPVAVQQGGVTFTSMTAGENHTCGLTGASQAYCWGSNWAGQLGDNTTTTRLTPVAVQQGGVTFTSITVGTYHTCALTGAGAAYCWGLNNFGQLGDNTTTNRSTPVAVQQGGVTFASITAGWYHTCGLTGAGAAWCWGVNWYGGLGDNTATDRSTPVAVQQSGLTFTSITTGKLHTCGITGAGAAYCWGLNANGQLGDQTTTERHTPVAVGGGVSWSVVVSSEAAGHTCAVKLSSHLIYCWGWNSNGQLGDQTTTDRSSPVQASAIPEAVAGVAVSFGMDPQLTFTVSSVAGALGCGDVTTTVASTTNAVSLGHQSSTASHPIGGQSLNVITNAVNGYTVYISYGAAMLGASSGHTFANMGGTNASPAAWPANGTEAFGYTTESSSLSGTPARFHSPAKWAALTATTGQEIMRNTTIPGVNGDTNCIAYEGSVAPNTPADAAYSTTVLYSVVPLF
jgi:alpha-tubulin suppressor-like RCC1 family protein